MVHFAALAMVGPKLRALLAVDEVAPAVAALRFDERHIARIGYSST